MRLTVLFFICICTGLAAMAQERGNVVLPYKRAQNNPLKGDSGMRKAALVVGISDYASKNLSLKYAHKDAVLVFDFLLGTRGFPKENIFFLPDSLATSGRIYNSIHDLMKWLAAGDELVLYFAGHGDVQTVADFDEAFFLAWDASDSRNYYGTAGTLKLADLDNYTNRLAGVKKVKVSLIMDACHAGFDLRKDGVLKAQENISNSFSNVNKMLGCAVNEFSYEADSIGHGLFSWYLVQGLMGLADVPADNNVTFAELKDWTEKRVAAASKNRQHPIVDAKDGNAVFAVVDAASKEAALTLVRQKTYGAMMAGRGMAEDDTLINARLQLLVDRYNTFLLNEQLYYGDSSCLGIIAQLDALPGSGPQELKQGLKNHLAEALETRSQLALNEYLKGKSELPPAFMFRKAGAEASIADSLLDAGDPRRRNDKVMANFHKAFSYIRYDDYEHFAEAEALLRRALQLEDRAAYLYVTMSYMMEYQNKFDSAIYYAKKAEAIIPTWSVPKNILGNLYHEIFQWEKAMDYHRQVLKLDSGYVWSYNNIGNALLDMDRIGEAEQYFLKALDMKQRSGKERLQRDWAISYSNLGVIYKERGLFAKAERFFRMADSIDHSFSAASQNLAEMYAVYDGVKAAAILEEAISAAPFDAQNYYDLAELKRKNSLDEYTVHVADSLYRKAIALNPFNEWFYAGLGYLSVDEKQPDSALYWFNKGIEVSRGSADAWYNLGYFYQLANKPDTAVLLYKKALNINPYDIFIADELAGLLKEQGLKTASIEVMEKASGMQQQSPKAMWMLGNVYFANGETGKALEAYRHSLANDAAYTPALKALMYLQLAMNLPEQSIAVFVQLAGLENDEVQQANYLAAVAEQALQVPVKDRSGWLSSFLALDPKHELLNELYAEAAYSAGTVSATIFGSLKTAEEALDNSSSALLRWLLLYAVELNDRKEMKHFAARYLSELLNPEPLIQAVALYITGDTTAATALKATLQPTDAAGYRSRFKKLFEKI